MSLMRAAIQSAPTARPERSCEHRNNAEHSIDRYAQSGPIRTSEQLRSKNAQTTGHHQGQKRSTVIGWRMHVTLVGGMLVDDLLFGATFKRHAGDAQPTHKRFGFVNSFREKRATACCSSSRITREWVATSMWTTARLTSPRRTTPSRTSQSGFRQEQKS